MTQIPASAPASAPTRARRLTHPLDTAAGRLRPTRAGLGFLLAVLLSLVGCINYDLSLGYALTFLLAGVWVTGAAYAARQAREAEVRLLPPATATAGGSAEYRLELRRRGSGLPFRAEVLSQSSGVKSAQAFTFPAQAEAESLSWTLPTPVRGPHDPAADLRLYDPLGLWQMSRPLTARQPLLVWPRAEASPPPPPQEAVLGGEEGVRRVRGDQEFSGLRPYVAGDPTRRISWRHSAGREYLAGGGLLVRETDAPATYAAALDWNALSGDPEARIARLAGWVNELSAAGQPFSLNLPAERLSLGSGEAQRQRALGALARVQPLPTAPAVTPQEQAAALKGLDKWQSRLLPHAWPWTLLAVVWVLMPTVTRTPIWATLLTGALVAFAYWREKRPAAAMSATTFMNLLALLAVAAIGGLYLNYGTLIGLEAGTNVLTLLLGLKVAESRSARDGVLVVLLGFFITLTHFLHSMSPTQALHVLVSAVLLLGALHLWSLPTRRGGPATDPASATNSELTLNSPVPPAWKVGLSLTLLSLPLMLALFFFFPRPEAPLWQFQQQSQQAKTGLGASVSAGDVSNLAQDNAVAFRATFEGAVPPASELYWRGPVFEAYDGLTWNVVRADVPAPTVQPTGPLYRYSVLQEPNGQPWILALDTVRTPPEGSLVTSALSVAARRPSSRATRYVMTSAPSRLGTDERQDRLDYDTQLPEGGQNPRALALAQSWRTLAPEQRVQAALELFGNGSYSYTLSPPTLPQENRVDAFLYSAQAGFCEHYASAFGFLMRAAGVPTRLVGGYLGGETAAGSQTITVRQSFAHVWNEVWLEGQGWVRVDPTAAVAPARLATDPGTALSDPNATSSRQPQGFLNRLKGSYDNLQLQWYDMVVNFDDESQSGTLNNLGFGEVGGSRYWVGFGGLLLLALLPLAWFWRSRSRPTEPAARALDDLTRRLGLPRDPSEPAGTYAARAGRKYPQLEPQLWEIAQVYNRLRYGSKANASDLSDLQRLVREVRRP